MEDLRKENGYLQYRIEFLEKINEINLETNHNLHTTIQKLFNHIEEMEEEMKGNKEVVTYFSPFTGEPVMVETETNKYMIDVKKVIEKED